MINIDGMRYAKIMVMVMRYVGDSIWTLPFFDNLKAHFPTAEITVVANKGADVFYYGYPAIDRVISYPKDELKSSATAISHLFKFISTIRTYGPDLVIDMTDSDKSAVFSFITGAQTRVGYSSYRKWRTRLYTDVVSPDISLHMVEYYLYLLTQLGVSVTEKKEIVLNRDDAAFNALLKKYPIVKETDRKKILIHLGARIELRQWGVDNFAELIRLLGSQYRVFVVAGPSERHLLRGITDAGCVLELCTADLNLQEFAELCGLSDVFIGNDSGPIHIAATKTFVIGMYGPNTDASAGPWTERKLVLECTNIECRPCPQGSCNNQEYKACLQGIKPEDVAEAVKRVLSSR